MKTNILRLIIFTILLSSCNQNNIKSKESIFQDKTQDSINRLIKEEALSEKKLKDSILKLEENKVLGDITFGMNEKLVEKKLKEFKLKNRKPNKDLGVPYYDDFIGGYEYEHITKSFHKNGLFEFEIMGKYIRYQSYETKVKEESEIVNKMLILKYGKPSISNELMPSYSMQNNFSYLINRWNIGKKVIETRISDEGQYYTINIEIYLPEIRQEIENEKLRLQNKEIEKAKDLF